MSDSSAPTRNAATRNAATRNAATRNAATRNAATRNAATRSVGAGLHVGLDAEKVVVASSPLRMRTGRARRRRWGSLTEVVPVAPSGRTDRDRTRAVSRLALVLTALVAVLSATGIAWWYSAVGAAALLVLVSREHRRCAAIGIVALPAEQAQFHALYDRQEREAFERCLSAAKRAQRTWPALGNMVDVTDAERMLAGALWDLSDVLQRRQQIRRLRTELSAVDHRDLPSDSPAVSALNAQRARLEQLWRDTGAEARGHVVSIHAVAAAGENLIREQRVGRTARAAEQRIAHLSTSVVPVAPFGPAGGQELADRTAAVIEAYRELAARHATAL